MIVVDLPQGSPEWLAERAGKITASNFNKIFTATGKPTTGETRKKYLYQLVAERLTGEPEPGFKSSWMERGNELEDAARLHFEQEQEVFVAQVGLVYLDELRVISCSPDGLIGDNSGLEIKCPKPSTHIAYLESGKLPAAYKPQVQGSMWVTGRDTWWFMSYCPGIAPLVMQVERDNGYIEKLSQAILEAENSISAMTVKHNLTSYA